jgi:hypothetical protein
MTVARAGKGRYVLGNGSAFGADVPPAPGVVPRLVDSLAAGVCALATGLGGVPGREAVEHAVPKAVPRANEIGKTRMRSIISKCIAM